ncbi:MurT ligase domain-containing protein [Actinomadura viridis]|uniref:Lipid II isoglutaminyl synthase (glutamine-hydrolyzing) subunit MurT n=1 Tax=Actinomadura viridis TaxID=58110 RepID=A0A931DR88_9ACTN|nr:MurT ligase domain-containing protein [Actinomadura viridis]MBG6093298.1 UDP-N-acetylmuramyl tripeptide synthase [Actinomadura viridis]
MSDLPLRSQLAVALGRTAAKMSRLAGRGDGSVIGGRIGLRLDPELLTRLARDRKLVLVSATNGKTTTTRLITSAMTPLGEVATNAFGANMPTGHVSALASAPDARYGVLECDEKYVPMVLAETGANVVALMNLSRDQMDRAAEIWLLAGKWRKALEASPQSHVIANCDDPLVTWGASTAKSVTWVAAGQHWREDSWCCPECGGPLDREETDENSDWRCRECHFARPRPDWILKGDQVTAPDGRAFPLSQLALPGRANRSNATIALAVVSQFGVPPEQALPLLGEVRSVAGRYTTVEHQGRHIRLLLSKNPAGWLEAFDVLEPAPGPVALSINAQGPDGRDTSWLWDVDYRILRGRPIWVTGQRRIDLAARLEAADVQFTVVDDIDQAVMAVPPGRLDVIANYTAFQDIRTRYGRVV